MHQRTKDAVYGFIKENSKLLLSNDSICYSNIPTSIIRICLEYYNGNIIYKSFEDMKLSKNLIEGIHSHGYENPSRVQSRSIVPMINSSVLAH